MRSTRMFLFVLPAVVVSGTTVLMYAQAQPKSYAGDEATLVSQESGASWALARRVVRNLGETFVGQIAFDHVLTTADGSEYHQYGRLYAGPTAEARLDLWISPEAEAPVTCCVTNRRVWMSWRDPEVAHESAYPINRRHQSGWLGQMAAQAGQTRSWSNMFLANYVVGAESREIKSARLENGSLNVVLAPGGERDLTGEVRIQAVYYPEFDEFLPTEIEMTGTTATFSEYVRAGDSKMIAGRITVQPQGTGIHTTWSVREVVPSGPSDSDFVRSFSLENTDARVKHDYDAFGNERLVWLAR